MNTNDIFDEMILALQDANEEGEKLFHKLNEVLDGYEISVALAALISELNAITSELEKELGEEYEDILKSIFDVLMLHKTIKEETKETVLN